MRWIRCGRWREERGSQMVEFALILPILVYLVLSVPVLGMVVRSWVVVEAAAREGARYLAIHHDPAGARRRAYDEVTLAAGLPTGNGDYFRQEDVEVLLDGTEAVVTVRYRQPTYLPWITAGGGALSEPYIEVRATARFLREGRG